MSNEIIISVVGAVFGLAGIIIGGWQSIRLEQFKATSSLQMERAKIEAEVNLAKLRAEVENDRKKTESAFEKSAAIDRAVGEAWSNAQTIKDEIRKLFGPRYDLDLALDVIKPSIQKLVAGYQQHGRVINGSEKVAFHELKNKSLGLLSAVEEFAIANGYRTRLSITIRKLLRAYHRDLSEIQSRLIAVRHLTVSD